MNIGRSAKFESPTSFLNTLGFSHSFQNLNNFVTQRNYKIIRNI